MLASPVRSLSDGKDGKHRPRSCSTPSWQRCCAGTAWKPRPNSLCAWSLDGTKSTLLIELGEFAVGIEAEFEPGRTVLADAEKRLREKPLYWRGLAVDSVFALVYPKELQRLPESRARAELAKRSDLVFERVDSRVASDSFGDGADEQGVRTKHTGSGGHSGRVPAQLLGPKVPRAGL